MSYLGKEVEFEDKLEKKIEKQGDFKKILFIGLSQTGKTSIINVVFSGWKPESTKDIPATINFSRQIKEFKNINVFVFDIGGQTSFLEQALEVNKQALFSDIHSIFYIIDASNFGEYHRSRDYFFWTLRTAEEFNKNTKIHMLIHKIDLIPDESQESVANQIRNIFNLKELDHIKVSLTSIYDTTTYDTIKEALGD